MEDLMGKSTPEGIAKLRAAEKKIKPEDIANI